MRQKDRRDRVLYDVNIGLAFWWLTFSEFLNCFHPSMMISNSPVFRIISHLTTVGQRKIAIFGALRFLLWSAPKDNPIGRRRRKWHFASCSIYIETGHTRHHDNMLHFDHTKLGRQDKLEYLGFTGVITGMSRCCQTLADEEVWKMFGNIQSINLQSFNSLNVA